MKKLWFKTKTYGWGWTPASWEGWVVLLVWFVVFVGVLAWFAPSLKQREFHPATAALLGFVFVWTTALVVLCWKKGEKPRWRWGR